MKELYRFRQFLTEGVIKEDQISPKQLEDMGYSAGEKAVMALDTELFNQPYFDQYADGFIKGFQDNIRASQDYAANLVAEGEIKKEESGVLQEYIEDYFTVSQNGQKYDFRFNSRVKAQRFIDLAMNDDEEYEKEAYKRYAERFKDNPEDMRYEPTPTPKYTIDKDQESRTMEEGKPLKEDYKNDIKEDEDYDTGGYVEAMNPELFDHIDEVIRIFKEWKDGPMTEPGMEGYAKDDLVDYIQFKIRNA